MKSNLPVIRRDFAPRIEKAMARINELKYRQADLGLDQARISDVVFSDPDLVQAIARHQDLVQRVTDYQEAHHSRKVPRPLAQDLYGSLIRALNLMCELAEGELDKAEFGGCL